MTFAICLFHWLNKLYRHRFLWCNRNIRARSWVLSSHSATGFKQQQFLFHSGAGVKCTSPVCRKLCSLCATLYRFTLTNTRRVKACSVTGKGIDGVCVWGGGGGGGGHYQCAKAKGGENIISGVARCQKVCVGGGGGGGHTDTWFMYLR